MNTGSKINEKKYLDKIKSHLMTYEEVWTVYLFGSIVKKHARKSSDLDLAVLFREGLDTFHRFELKLHLTNELEELVQAPVDLADLRSADDYFIHQIMKNKVLLLDKNTSARVNFEVNHRKRYFDQMHFYFQYRNQAIKRLKENYGDDR